MQSCLKRLPKCKRMSVLNCKAKTKRKQTKSCRSFAMSDLDLLPHWKRRRVINHDLFRPIRPLPHPHEQSVIPDHHLPHPLNRSLPPSVSHYPTSRVSSGIRRESGKSSTPSTASNSSLTSSSSTHSFVFDLENIFDLADGISLNGPPNPSESRNPMTLLPPHIPDRRRTYARGYVTPSVSDRARRNRFEPYGSLNPESFAESNVLLSQLGWGPSVIDTSSSTNTTRARSPSPIVIPDYDPLSFLVRSKPEDDEIAPEGMDDRFICCICFTNIRNVNFDPCGHGSWYLLRKNLARQGRKRTMSCLSRPH